MSSPMKTLSSIAVKNAVASGSGAILLFDSSEIQKIESALDEAGVSYITFSKDTVEEARKDGWPPSEIMEHMDGQIAVIEMPELRATGFLPYP